MIGQFHAEETEPTAKREICSVCGKPSIPHDSFDDGPLCRRCWSEATEIYIAAVIRGRTRTKHLRSLKAIESPKNRKAGAAVTATGQKAR